MMMTTIRWGLTPVPVSPIVRTVHQTGASPLAAQHLVEQEVELEVLEARHGRRLVWVSLAGIRWCPWSTG